MKFEDVKKALMNFANKWLYRWLVKKIFGGALGGIKGWLVSMVFGYIWENLIKPLVKWASRKGKTWWHSRKNDEDLEELHDAKTEAEFDKSVDNLP